MRTIYMIIILLYMSLKEPESVSFNLISDFILQKQTDLCLHE